MILKDDKPILQSYERYVEVELEGRTLLMEDGLFDIVTRLHDVRWDITKGKELEQAVERLNDIQNELEQLTKQLQRFLNAAHQPSGEGDMNVNPNIA